MANVNFGTFTTVTPQGTDFLVGYRNASETKTSIDSITALNLSYQYTTDTLRSNSGRYDQSYNSVSLMSPSTGLWNSAYTTVSSFSGFWGIQPNLSDIVAASGNWNEAYFQSVPAVSFLLYYVNTLQTQMSGISMVSGYWDSTYSNVYQNSAAWNNSATTVATNSAYWTNAFDTASVYQTNSASYVVNGGNVFGSNIQIGATDDYSVSILANNQVGLTVLSAGRVQEGSGIATGSFSHAEGVNALASGNDSHAQNFNTIAAGFASHAEGGNTVARGQFAHAGGYYVEAAHAGSWAWRGDSTATDLVSTTRTNQFMVSARGGVFLPGAVGIGTDSQDNALTVVGTISAASNLIIFPNLPTSSAGLPTGAIWNDGGFLKIA